MHEVYDVLLNEPGVVSTDSMTPAVCKGCGCRCDCCGSEPDSYLDLHQQIAELHNQLHKSNAHISNVEQELMDSKANVDVEVIKVREDHLRLRDRYDRLLESHKKMQKLNHDLEDKLLKSVGRFEAEKVALQHEVSSMMSKVVDARILINQLDEENERYRNDCNMAVQLLQCKPSNFVAHKLNTLPLDLQERVKQHMSRDQIVAAEKLNGIQEEQRLIRVPMATFPPTAIMYSLDQNAKRQQQEQQQQNDVNDKGYVPLSLIARVLTQSDSRKILPRSFLCIKCKTDVQYWDKGCQVDLLPSVSYGVKVTSRPGVHRKPNQFRSSSFGEESLDYMEYDRKREHCLSSSSTETEI